MASTDHHSFWKAARDGDTFISSSLPSSRRSHFPVRTVQRTFFRFSFVCLALPVPISNDISMISLAVQQRSARGPSESLPSRARPGRAPLIFDPEVLLFNAPRTVPRRASYSISLGASKQVHNHTVLPAPIFPLVPRSTMGDSQGIYSRLYLP